MAPLGQHHCHYGQLVGCVRAKENERQRQLGATHPSLQLPPSRPHYSPELAPAATMLMPMTAPTIEWVVDTGSSR
jgi:hypothetical protein